MEHDPSPTESELLLDLENAFDDDQDPELDERLVQERKGFVARSASFNGPNGAFVRYQNVENLPKRSSSFCESTQRTKSWVDSSEPVEEKKTKKKRRVKRERRVEKTDRGLSVRRLSDSVQLKPVPDLVKPAQPVTEKPKPDPPIRRKLLPPVAQKAILVPTLEIAKNDAPTARVAKPVSIPDVPTTYVSKSSLVLSVVQSSLSEKKDEFHSISKTTETNKAEKVLEIKIPETNESDTDGADNQASGSDVLSPISEASEPVVPPHKKSLPYRRPNVQSPKGALTVLFEKGLQEIQRKSGVDFPECDIISENPFRNPSPPPFVHRKPHTLRVKVGFESPTIGQGISTPPSETNTEEKTLPYYLKSIGNVNADHGPVKSERIESNIEYEKSIELGKKLIKVPEAKTPEPREIHYIIEDRRSPSPPPVKTPNKRAEVRLKIKVPKPDFTNEIREEVEPITPDTDQSELEDILETFSKEVQQADIEEILSGDESRHSRTPRTFLETAFLSSPMPEGGMESRRAVPLRSGRESAPLIKNFSSPDHLVGRQSVPVDHPQALRTRSLSRDGYRGMQESKARMAVSPNAKSDPRGPYSPTEIEAIFWARLKQKKIKAALREQELLKANGSLSPEFSRNSPQRSTIGPIFQKEYENFATVQLRQKSNGAKPESPVPRSQSAMDFTKKKEGIMSKIPFFRRRSKSSKDEGAYKKTEDVCDEPTPIFKRGSLISNASSTDETPTSPKKVSFDQQRDGGWNGRNGDSGRPLPPVPAVDSGGYGVIARPNARTQDQPSQDLYGRPATSPNQGRSSTPKSASLKENAYCRSSVPEVAYGRSTTPSKESAYGRSSAPEVAYGRSTTPSKENVYGRSSVPAGGSENAYGGVVRRENDTVYGVARGPPIRPGHLALRGDMSRRAAIRVSDTESGSEAGEVQRIMLGVRLRGTCPFLQSVGPNQSPIPNQSTPNNQTILLLPCPVGIFK